MRKRLQQRRQRRRAGPVGQGCSLPAVLAFALALGMLAGPVHAAGTVAGQPAAGAIALPAVSSPSPELEAGRAWRTAREDLRRARALPPGAPGRREAVLAARDEARRGTRGWPDCAECCLYDFAATAQLAAGGGRSESLGFAREAGRILERCLAAPPTSVDQDGSSEEAKLYYGASQYFRRLPQSRLLRFALGVGGDAGRAVDLARRAVLLEPANEEYRLELAAALLCRARHGGGAQERAEAVGLLGRLGDAASTSERRAAEQLAAAPDDACAFGERFPGAEVAQGRP